MALKDWLCHLHSSFSGDSDAPMEECIHKKSHQPWADTYMLYRTL